MTDAPAITAATVADDLSRIDSVIAAAERLLGDGRVVDISAIEARTEQMCARVLALPTTDRHALRDGLEALLARFDALADAMRARFGDLPVMPPTRGATAAYAALLKHFP